MLPTNACIEAWLRGKVNFHFMNLHRDMVSADTDHALVIFVCLWALFLPSQSETMTEQDTRYILRMKSRGKGTDSPLSKKNVKPLLETGFTNTEGAPTVCTSSLLQVLGHKMSETQSLLCVVHSVP